MKSLKDSFFVKTVYAYANLLTWIYPIFFFFVILGIIGTSSFFSNADLLGLTGKGENYLNNHWANSEVRFLIVAINLGFLITTYMGLKRLLKFMKNVFEEKPFVEENGKNLKFIGIITMALTIVVHLTSEVSRHVEVTAVVSQTTKFLILLSNSLGVVFNPYLILGMFVYVIGEIVIHAAKLKEEIDLTV